MLTRLAIVTGVSATIVVIGSIPALADDGWAYVDCSEHPFAGCELGAGKDGQRGSSGAERDPAPERGRADRGTGTDRAETRGDRIVGGNANLASCSYRRSDFDAPGPGEVAPASHTTTASGGVVVAIPALYRPQAQPQDDSGAWYVYRCTGPGVRDSLYRPPVWIPDDRPGTASAPSPAELARQARSQLRLPTPAIYTDPAGDQLVHLPTWLWLDRTTWTTVSATASVPRVSVTATARPSSVTWSMGDGHTVRCSGPGTPYPADTDPQRESPDCGHTYRTSSAAQPDEKYSVIATVHWTVTWSGAGQSGELDDLTTRSTTVMRVAESQALNTGGG